MERQKPPQPVARVRGELALDDWVLKDDTVPESRPHDDAARRLDALLRAWVERTGRNAQIGRNLALRMDQNRPRLGVDPDVYLIEPPPPEDEDEEVLSHKLWEPGRVPPRLAVEVVSRSRSSKDYTVSPLKYDICGVEELWVFDRPMKGRKKRIAPIRLQMWRRQGEAFPRVYAGDGPAWSEVLSAWVFVVDEGQALAIANDEAGTSWWLDAAGAERAEKERERAAKEEALRRVAELEARLAAR